MQLLKVGISQDTAILPSKRQNSEQCNVSISPCVLHDVSIQGSMDGSDDDSSSQRGSNGSMQPIKSDERDKRAPRSHAHAINPAHGFQFSRDNDELPSFTRPCRVNNNATTSILPFFRISEISSDMACSFLFQNWCVAFRISDNRVV